MNEVEFIRELLLKYKHPSYQTTNRKEVRVRCPYCGDSVNDKSSAHFYISMTPPFCFHCFKCETSGVLNSQTLRDLEIYDAEASVNILKANKNAIQNNTIQKISVRKRELKNAFYETSTSKANINYFNFRYGTNLPGAYISETFKAVLDPLVFFKENNILPPQVSFNFSTAIGFISSDASHIIFRDTSGQQKTRYFNLNLNPFETGSKIYNISTSVDALEEEMTLIITEGIFDIIGVKIHFFEENNSNIIFAAACGKAYNAVILKYIRMGFLNLNIKIFSDGDVDNLFYKKMKESSPYLKNTIIEIYRNSLYNPNTKFGKDFGVSKSEISLKKFVI